jgi:hypothetical protein
LAKLVNDSEGKTAFERRLKAEGRWGRFVQRREAIKKAGDGSVAAAWDAWVEAAKDFPPPLATLQVAPQITPALGTAAGGGVTPPALPPPDDSSFTDTLRSDALWAYHNATNPLAVADTPGRQLMLSRAQGDDTRKEFYALIDRLAVKSVVGNDLGGEASVKPVLSLIQRVAESSEYAVQPGAQAAG